jgi:hypothetical protein
MLLEPAACGSIDGEASNLASALNAYQAFELVSHLQRQFSRELLKSQICALFAFYMPGV